jgi:N-acetylmuramoyl-L-alanine amidase
MEILYICLMRKIDTIILHCSATREGQDFSVDTIRKWHLKRGWSDIGYHYVISLDGSVHEGRPVEKIGAHCKGKNTGSIGICYIGGVEADGKTPKDTMTDAQDTAMVNLIQALRQEYKDNGKIALHGHNEFAPKACPSFSVPKKYDWLL